MRQVQVRLKNAVGTRFRAIIVKCEKLGEELVQLRELMALQEAAVHEVRQHVSRFAAAGATVAGASGSRTGGQSARGVAQELSCYEATGNLLRRCRAAAAGTRWQLAWTSAHLKGRTGQPGFIASRLWEVVLWPHTIEGSSNSADKWIRVQQLHLQQGQVVQPVHTLQTTPVLVDLSGVADL